MKQRLTLLFLSLFVVSCSKLILVNIEKHQYPIWPMLGGNPAHTNFSTDELQLPLKLKWKNNLQSSIGKTLLSADSVLFVVTKEGRIYGLHTKDGKKLGTIKFPKDDAGTCVYEDGYLLITRNRAPHVLFKSLNSGKTKWKTRLGASESEPAISDGQAFISTFKGILYCIDLENGEKKWSFNLKAQSHAAPSVAGNRVLVGNDQGKLYCLSKESGKSRWQFETGRSIYAAPLLSDSVAFIGSTDSVFYALEINTGKMLWQFQTNGKLYRTGAVAGQFVLFGSTDHNLYCLEKSNGHLKWQFSAKSVIGTSPLIVGNAVIFGSLDQHIYIVDLDTGRELWKFKTDKRIRTNPIVVHNELFVGTEDGDVYCFTSNKDE